MLTQLLVLGAGDTCRAGGHIGGPMHSFPNPQVRRPKWEGQGDRGLTYRKNYIVNHLLATPPQRKKESARKVLEDAWLGR